MSKGKSDSRFGFGQLVGSVGVVLVGISVSQPFLQLDMTQAFADALRGGKLDAERAGQILFVGTSTSPEKLEGSPQVAKLAEQLGVAPTGWEQNHLIGAALIAAALLSLIGIVRSVTASSAWGARTNSPLLAIAGLGSLALAAVSLWVTAPQPRDAMRPDLGLWLIVGGGVCLLLGALTLGNNRRRPWIDELDRDEPMKTFDNTEHLAYSHGAWVPKLPEDR